MGAAVTRTCTACGRTLAVEAFDLTVYTRVCKVCVARAARRAKARQRTHTDRARRLDRQRALVLRLVRLAGGQMPAARRAGVEVDDVVDALKERRLLRRAALDLVAVALVRAVGADAGEVQCTRCRYRHSTRHSMCPACRAKQRRLREQQRRAGNAGHVQCGACGERGHNERTCALRQAGVE